MALHDIVFLTILALCAILELAARARHPLPTHEFGRAERRAEGWTRSGSAAADAHRMLRH